MEHNHFIISQPGIYYNNYGADVEIEFMNEAPGLYIILSADGGKVDIMNTGYWTDGTQYSHLTLPIGYAGTGQMYYIEILVAAGERWILGSRGVIVNPM
jgi:hypothetical protein